MGSNSVLYVREVATCTPDNTHLFCDHKLEVSDCAGVPKLYEEKLQELYHHFYRPL